MSGSFKRQSGGSKGKAPHRGGQIRQIGNMIPSITRRALGRHGFAHASVITDWEKIVGKGLADQSQPIKLYFPKGERLGGTLHIRVSGPLATQMQHMEPQVIEQINAHFGYGAVARIKLIQGPIRKNPSKVPKKREILPPAQDCDMKMLDQELADVEDPEIRAVLRRMGETILRRKNATKSEE